MADDTIEQVIDGFISGLDAPIMMLYDSTDTDDIPSQKKRILLEVHFMLTRAKYLELDAEQVARALAAKVDKIPEEN